MSHEIQIVEVLGKNNFSRELTDRRSQQSIIYWADRYWRACVVASPPGTQQAKRTDLNLFLGFFIKVVGSEEMDYWTPSISKAFRRWLQTSQPNAPAREHSAAYAPSSINRMTASLRHFAGFIQGKRPFQAGNPFEGLRDLALPCPVWNGLSDLELMRLRAALDQLCVLQSRQNQSPDRNRAVFTLALHTGLRASELVGLDLHQFQGKYLVHVRGKGEQIDDIYLSTESRNSLEIYLKNERGCDRGPLFLTRRGGRLSRQQVDAFLRQVAALANAKLSAEEHIHLHAHKLRHTSVKRVHDARGPLAAKKFSRHRSFAQLERYATQTRDEHEKMVDELFE